MDMNRFICLVDINIRGWGGGERMRPQPRNRFASFLRGSGRAGDQVNGAKPMFLVCVLPVSVMLSRE